MRELRLILPLLVLAVVLIAGPPAPASAPSAQTPTARAAQAARPSPAVPVSSFARRLQRALTRRGCPGLAAINRAGQIVLPCPSASRRAARAFRGFRVRGTRTYGTGAVIDFTDAEAPRGGTYVLALTRSRRWSIVFAPRTDRRTSRDPGPGDLTGPQAALAGFLPAVRDGDCAGYFRFAVTRPGETPAQACRTAFGERGLYTGLQGDLRATPGAQPAPMGGNRTFAFFALRTGATYRTAITMRSPPGATEPFLVLTTERG
jgi:hypothetical protein